MDWQNPTHVMKALVFLYNKQTVEEKVSGATIQDNSQGFNAVDAPFCSSIAEQLLIDLKGLSTKQIDSLNTVLFKYMRQLEEMDLDAIVLPPTAVVYDSKKKSRFDGKLTYDEPDDRLIFIPFIYPTTQAKQAGFKYEQLYKDYDRKGWIADANVHNYNRLISMFKITADATVEEWLAASQDEVLPEVHKSAFYFQRQCVGFMVDSKRCLINLSPGLGKSLCAIEAAKLTNGKTLIVAPLSLLRNWVNELRAWFPEADVEIWRRHLGTSTDFVITNYETIRDLWVVYDEKIIKTSTGTKKIQRINWECIVEHDFTNFIIDESALIKNRKAQRMNAVKAVAKTIENVWELSGFPATRFYDDLWAQFNTLHPKRFTSYWRFAKDYCYVEANQWGGYVVKQNQSDAAERIKRDFGDIYFSRTQDQVLDLPDWIIENREIEMYPDQYKHYLDMEKTFKTMLPDGDMVLAPIVLTQLLRLVQFASNPILIGGDNKGAKWDALFEIMQYEQPPFIIWTSFIKTAELIQQKLRKKRLEVAVLTGKTPPAIRQSIIDAFQRNETDVIVAHPGVGKYGFTLTAARTSIYLERGYSADDYYQSLHRVRRIGTMHSPHVLHLIAARPENSSPTVDHVIDKVLENRKEMGMKLTAGEIRDAFGFGE